METLFPEKHKVAMASEPIMSAPMCLVENKNQQMSVNQRALKILYKISQPVVVVAIVGVYRTGKSYLMNCLAGEKLGFPLGSTVQSETKGIWMWCVPHPSKHDHTLVLLDTEGLGDVEKGDSKNDSWIFALSVLLSSTLVYNSMSTINNDALEKLHYVTELTEFIRAKSSPTRSEEDSSEFVSFFPDFIWAVRDFTLELKLNGHPITEDEYLENSLKLIPGLNPRAKNSNIPRECIRNYFPKRKCFVFDRPTKETELLAKLETILESQLDPKFREQSDKFCYYIFNHAKTKLLREGVKVTGNRLGTLVVTYVDTINSGAVPCLENAVTALAELENSAAVQKAADHYTEQMAQRVSFPTDSLQELLDLHAACEREAIAIFMERSFKDDKRGFQTKLMSDPENDSWIFALAVLLSSMLVYNSVDTINHQALEQLHYVTELTKLIRTKSSPSSGEVDDSAEFVSFFPDFVWAVRDFLLELKLNGRTITEDEYLENALKLIPGEDPKIQKSNMPREYIRKFFPRRKCFVFDWPTNDKKLLQHMEKVSENQLGREFQEQSRTFCTYIFTHAKTKTLRQGITITGNGLGTLAKTYVDAINSGVVPCLENAVTTLAELENSAAVQKAADHYTEQMAQRVSFPTDSLQELLDLHAACEREAIAIFMERSFKDDKREFQKKLVETIEMKKQDFLLQNEQASGKYCQAQLEQLSEPLKDDISRGTFSVPGGHNLYLEAVEKLEQSYNLVPRKGVKANEVLQTFLQSQATTKESILQADQALSAEEKALAAECAKNWEAEKELDLRRQKEKEQQKVLEAQEKTFKENLAQLKEKMERELETRLREQESMLELKSKISEELLNEGFKAKNEEMQKEIDQLKEEKERNNVNKASDILQILDVATTVLAAVLPCLLRYLH
ncbi:guanylate-binding protein 7-like isoform 13-T14 [Molossus nigricans]